MSPEQYCVEPYWDLRQKGNVCPIYTYQNVLPCFEPSVKVNESSTTTTKRLTSLHADVKFERGKKKTPISHSRETLQGPVQNENTGLLLQKLMKNFKTVTGGH